MVRPTDSWAWLVIVNMFTCCTIYLLIYILHSSSVLTGSTTVLGPNHPFNPLTAGAAYIWVFIFYQHIKYNLLNMLKIKCDINQQYLKTVDLHFVKSE